MRRCVLFLLLLCVPLCLPAAAQKEKIPVTGTAVPALAGFDKLMLDFLAEHDVPGGALAVSHHGRIVYARGFGYADLQGKTPVLPASLFRIASISKPITAAAVLRLVEQGKLRLDDKLADLLHVAPQGRGGKRRDPRLRRVTVRHLLRHTAGWDRAQSFDPMFRSVTIADALGSAPPAGPREVVAWMMDQPLDFEPGARYAYSNFGYCLLGRVIEEVTGESYEAFVRKNVLAPAGVTAMRLGKTRRADRAAGEVAYHVGDRTGPSVFAADVGRPVPLPYGAWCLEAMDAHGGWLASAPDLLRFAAALDGTTDGKLLRPESVKALFARPEGSAGYHDDGTPRDAYYGCGWMVRPVGGVGRFNSWHAGALAGTSTLLVRRHDGIHWAVLFNARSGKDGQNLSTLIDPQLHRVADAVWRR